MTQPQQLNITPEQIQLALRSGLEILSDPQLKVSLGIVNNLTILRALLEGLQSGQLALSRSPEVSNQDPKEQSIKETEEPEKPVETLPEESKD